MRDTSDYMPGHQPPGHVSVHLIAEQLAAVRAYAERRGVSVSRLIVKALEEVGSYDQPSPPSWHRHCGKWYGFVRLAYTSPRCSLA